VEIDGRWYVDGALKKTLHASVALKEGARLVLCINPLVPFDATHASHEKHVRQRRLVDGGLPVVLAQTFRAIIHSRMKTGLAKYDIEYKDADVILFEPDRDDADMFFTNMFSYADRKQLVRKGLPQDAGGTAAAGRRTGAEAGAPRRVDQSRGADRSAPLAGAPHGSAQAAPRAEHGPYGAAPVRHAGRPGAARSAFAAQSRRCLNAGDDGRMGWFCYPRDHGRDG
jgi:hypothetical protein